MNKFKRSIITGAIGIIGFTFCANASLIVSADGNIATYLNYGASTNPGNQQFFSNVLGDGKNVLVYENVGWGGSQDFDINVNSYYNTLSGVSSKVTKSVTDALLADIDLFVAAVPDKAFTSSELNSLNTFYNNGGSIMFLGENNSFARENAYINAALVALGSGMSIQVSDWEPATTISGNHIANDPLTAGVNSLTYAWQSEVTGGTALFYGSNNKTLIAYETKSVPEPSILMSLCLGLSSCIGFGIVRRRK
jgi:hypothetical protein